MKWESGHHEISNSGWIRLHASILLETKAVHKIISINSTLSVLIKVYLQSSLSSISNEVFFTVWISHWTTGSSTKSKTLSQTTPGIYDMSSNLLCFV